MGRKSQFNSRWEKKQNNHFFGNKKQTKQNLIEFYKDSKYIEKWTNESQKSYHKASKDKLASSYRKAQKKERVYHKRNALDALGFSDALSNVFSDSFIDRITWSEIRSGEVDREKHSKLFRFNANKVYHMKQSMCIAFCDYAGEADFEKLISHYDGWSYERLLKELEEIVKKPETRTSSRSGSSGAPGNYMMNFTKNNLVMWEFDMHVRAENERMKLFNRMSKLLDYKWQSRGDNIGYQYLEVDNNIYFNEVTPKALLKIANAVMWNVTEDRRVQFYNEFCWGMEDNIPEFRKELPDPIYG